MKKTIKKLLNLLSFVLPFFIIGFELGRRVGTDIPRFTSLVLGVALPLSISLRILITNGNTALYTSEEYKAKDQKLFEFEED